jgi:formate hydrogenlyase subunit 3/multisubunit Na+/H+ antiporter MnhD subunit
MLLACLWPSALNRMFFCLPFAPVPALAAVLFAPARSSLILGSPRLHLSFAFDVPGALLLGVAALLWITSGTYALSYLKGRPNQARFIVCWLMALTGCIGVFLASDMAGFYFLLALLTIGACGLITYHDTPRAWRAAAIYIVLALLAESLLLVAFVMLAAEIPGHSLLIRDATAALSISPHRDLILALLIAGFGTKAGLAPFHFWMPLAYSAAPTPASAVLSGAVVKASVLGMIRFLPLETAIPDWGTAIGAAGGFAAIYGVVIGLTQRDPKVVLAYSSVSQMGFMIGIIGMGMIAGDGRAALATAFYAANHVLVKGALFLSVGVIVATSHRHLWWMLLPVAVIAVGIGGLPLTGGGLAKLVVGGQLGDGTANTVATTSAIATTLLMLQFLRSLANSVSQQAGARAPAGLVWPWLATAAASLAVPWTLFLGVPDGMLPDPFAAAVVWKALWPVLAGAVLAIPLLRWTRPFERVPAGDIAVVIDRLAGSVHACGKSMEGIDRALRQWPAAGVSLLLLIIALSAAIFAR